MGFLNLSAWRSVGGSVPAERRATSALAQSPKYYYDHLSDFQVMVDRYAEEEGHRPGNLAELYVWHLEQEDKLDEDERGIDLADFLAYFDIEPHSQLGMVAIDPDKTTRARKLLEVRQLYRMKKLADERTATRAAAKAAQGLLAAGVARVATGVGGPTAGLAGVA